MELNNENALVILNPTIESEPQEIDLSDRMSILHPNLANARQELDRCLCRAIDSTADGDETKLTLSIGVTGMGMMKLLKYKIDVKTTREIDGGKGSIPNMVYKYDELGRLHAYEPQVSMDDIKKRGQVDIEDLSKDVTDDEYEGSFIAYPSDHPDTETDENVPTEAGPEEGLSDAADEIPENERECNNCKDEMNDSKDGPCSSCDPYFSNWTRKAQK